MVPSFPRRLRATILLLLFCCCYPTALQAMSGDWLPPNTRMAIDVASRTVDQHGTRWHQQALGLDVHSVISRSSGDIGVLTFQPYLVRIDDAPGVPAGFDDNHDQDLRWRITNFNLTRFGRGRTNLRIGHFELPFGLEQVIDTNGTFHQMNSPAALGLKADWGVSINGVLPAFEYEVAHMTGSNNDLSLAGDGYVVGRIGLPRDRYLWFGVSFLDGTTSLDSNAPTQRRYGIDLGWQLPYGFGLLTEASRGTDGSADVAHQSFELNYRTPQEQSFFYLQLRRRTDDRLSAASQRTLRIGVRYEPNQYFTASAEVGRRLDFDTDPNTVALQLRVRL